MTRRATDVERSAADVMQSGVVTVSPELPVSELEEFLTGEEIGGAPVLDGEGKLVGIATKTDIVRALSESPRWDEWLAPDAMVRDIMTRDVVMVSPADSVADVARLMIEERVHRVLVVDRGSLRGIITTFDLLKLLA